MLKYSRKSHFKPSKPKSKPTTPEQNEDPNKRDIKSLVIYGLLGLVIITLIIALVLFFVLFNKSVNVCKTPECITLAHQLLNFRDDSVDPCNDFYKYSCGKYNEHVSVEGDGMLKKALITRGLIKEFLLKNASTTSKSEMAMKQLYSKCEEYKQILKQGKRQENLDQLRAEIQQLAFWSNSNFDLTGNIVYTELYGEQHKNNSQLAITSIAEISIELANLIPTNPSRKNHLIEFSKLKASLPQIDFERIFRALLGSQSLQDIDRNVYGIGAFDEIIPGIHSLIEGKGTILAGFLISRYAWLSMALLPKETIPCHGYVVEILPWPSTRVFVRNHFDKEGLKDVEELVEDIRSGYIEMFENAGWLDDSTKKNVIRKAEKMKKMIGYGKHFESPGALDRVFDANILPDDTYHATLKKIEKLSIKLAMDYGFLGTHMHPMFSLQANAFYVRFENTLSVLTPLMDDPFYHKSYPTYAKLAGTGYIIGHEIGHGFDKDGLFIDENGNPKKLFTPAVEKESDIRGTCLIDQYTNYDHPSFGKNLDGDTTLSENIADNLGNKVLWKAFKKLDLSNEKKIVGFEDYSIEKLYFQIEALNWCAPRSTTPLQLQRVAVHGTSSFRVNGVFSNMKEFSEAFNCPAGSPMNPAKKCELF